MLIDDEASVLIGLRLLLDWAAHDAEICGTFQHPDQALEAAAALQPDLIITDIEMPEISGLDLIVSLQSICPNTTCVILSAYSDFRYAQRAVELGVYRYLLKPLAADTLSKLLHRVHSRIAPAKPTEHQLMRALVVKEILLNGTDFRHITTFPSFCDLTQENNFQIMFLRPKDPEYDLIALQQILQKQLTEYVFRRESELIILLDKQSGNAIAESLEQSYQDTFMLELSEPFTSLSAGHELLSKRHSDANRSEADPEDDFSVAGSSQEAVQKAMAYIQEHYMEHDFRLATVSDVLYMNNSYLSHIFKQKTGTTLYQYLLDIRMQKAKQLLADSTLTVAEIGYRVGYAIPKNFYSAFKKYYSESPRSYQKRKLDRK